MKYILWRRIEFLCRGILLKGLAEVAQLPKQRRNIVFWHSQQTTEALLTEWCPEIISTFNNQFSRKLFLYILFFLPNLWEKIKEVLSPCQSIVDPWQGQTSQTRTVIPQFPIYQIFIETWKPVRTLQNAISERVLSGFVVQHRVLNGNQNHLSGKCQKLNLWIKMFSILILIRNVKASLLESSLLSHKYSFQSRGNL